MNENATSKAEQEAEDSFKRIIECIDNDRSFILEAGAGAGKTYTLGRTLKYVLSTRGDEFRRLKRRIACITYTNVASKEIKATLDNIDLVLSSTIHSFCWSLIGPFQNLIRQYLTSNVRWQQEIDKGIPITQQRIIYDLGIRIIEEGSVSINHDDVIDIFCHFLDFVKFQKLLLSQFPIILVDEYQDSNKRLIDQFLHRFISETSNNLILGFYGDHWQKIYDGNVTGQILDKNIVTIPKKSNFRSEPVIVSALNNIRPILPQEPYKSGTSGKIHIFHSNNWRGVRETRNHWQGNLLEDTAKSYFEATKEKLVNLGWDFSIDETKVLMLTHRALSMEQGYPSIASLFTLTDFYIKKQDPYIAFFADIVEPMVEFFEANKYGKMFRAISRNPPKLSSPKDKIKWFDDIETLIKLRNDQTVGDVIEHLKGTKLPPLPLKILDRENKIGSLTGLEDEIEKEVLTATKLRKIKYSEIISLCRFINDQTPFSTKHGVKGAEFDNVLIVFGRGWNNYNFDRFLNTEPSHLHDPKEIEFYERNRNLFYVCCSRAKKNLALLFTQELSQGSLDKLANYFGHENIAAIQI